MGTSASPSSPLGHTNVAAMRRSHRPRNDLHTARALLHFTITAHLDAAPRSTGNTGRIALAVALGLTDGQLSTRISGTTSTLVQLAAEMEERGFAPHGWLTPLARDLGVGHHWDVAPRLWPRVRETAQLGVEGTEPVFRSAYDVVHAAEAFVSHHRRVLQRVPNTVAKALPDHEILACHQLLDRLCWYGTGPFGVARDCFRLIATLVPLGPELVAATVRRGGTEAQLVRTFDPADGPARWNRTTRQEFSHLLANPPGKLLRRVYWLRALRRLRQSDFAPGGEPAPRKWILDQLTIALRGEQAYEGIRAHERRYALWCAAEMLLHREEWAVVRRIAADHAELAELLPAAETMRQHLESRPLQQRDGFWYTPPTGWPALSRSMSTREILDPSRVRRRNWSQAATWSWAMPATRETALRLLRDAILGPCAVRDRWAIDTLRAAGAAARYAVVQTVRGVYSSELAASSPHPVILERCLYLLGIMGHPAGIEPVEKTLSAGMGPTGALLVQTIQATGDLAHREPVAATGLVAWAERRLGTAVMDEELAMAAIHAAVACRKDPATWITTPLPDTDAVKAMSAWAVKVRADPLLPRRTPV